MLMMKINIGIFMGDGHVHMRVHRSIMMRRGGVRHERAVILIMVRMVRVG